MIVSIDHVTNALLRGRSVHPATHCLDKHDRVWSDAIAHGGQSGDELVDCHRHEVIVLTGGYPSQAGFPTGVGYLLDWLLQVGGDLAQPLYIYCAHSEQVRLLPRHINDGRGDGLPARATIEVDGNSRSEL